MPPNPTTLLAHLGIPGRTSEPLMYAHILNETYMSVRISPHALMSSPVTTQCASPCSNHSMGATQFLPELTSTSRSTSTAGRIQCPWTVLNPPFSTQQIHPLDRSYHTHLHLHSLVTSTISSTIPLITADKPPSLYYTFQMTCTFSTAIAFILC